MLDYELDDIFHANTPEIVKALVDPVRTQILDLVLERAATTTEMAAALERPKSSIAHHVDVLVNTGLLKVVRTRKVRAIEERFFGRSARRIVVGRSGLADGVERPSLLDEAVSDANTADAERVLTTLRYARIPAETADAFFARLADLADEFSALERGGDNVHGLVISVFPTKRASLPPA